MEYKRENLGPFDRVWADKLITEADRATVFGPAAMPDEPTAFEGQVSELMGTPRMKPVLDAILNQKAVSGGDTGDQTVFQYDGNTGRLFYKDTDTGFAKVLHSVPQQKTVDPMWDRYFEMAFEECFTALRSAPNGLVDGTEPVTVEVAAARLADRMLAERCKRAK